MKLTKKQIVVLLFFILILIAFLFNYNVYAKNEVELGILEYSEQYKKWLELPEEKRNDIIAPRMYDIKVNSKQTKLFKTNNLPKYSLQEVIPENIVVRNQMQTNSCWAFSAIGALESTLGLQDYKAGNPRISYDFSERHMEYATSRTFLNGEINKMGHNRQINVGGNARIAFSYFSGGLGPIDENSMPFVNNANLIKLSEIQNKKVTAKVTDTIDFPSLYDNSIGKDSETIKQNKEIVKQQIKDHILNYGGVTVCIYGAQINSEYYNNSTGAIYCDECQPNHNVLIIGWDDTYSVENFNSRYRPQNPGAWIIKNSWGTSVGKNGIMYLSYEDANVYYYLAAIQKASTDVDYDNIYQYNKYGYNAFGYADARQFGNKLYLANEFEKKNSGKEYLKEISIYAPSTSYTYEVYVNAVGTDKEKSEIEIPNGTQTVKLTEWINNTDLTKVELKEGQSESFGIGYHTIEFESPIEIQSDKFIVVVAITSNIDDLTYYSLETNETGEELYNTAEIIANKCFLTVEPLLEEKLWYSLSDKEQIGMAANSTIKAFTINGDDIKLGDVNNDGKINQKDAKLVLKAFAGKTNLTDKQKISADVNKDGKINQKDAKQILKFFAGKITSF